MFNEREPNSAGLTPELAALQTQLAALPLAAPTIDRDRLMFAAGRAAALSERQIAASGHRPKGGQLAGAPPWIWPTTTALTTAACIMLSLVLVWRDQAPNVANQPSTPQPTTDHLAAEPTTDDFHNIEQLTSRFDSPRPFQPPTRGYLNFRYVALTEGLNAIAHDRVTNRNAESSNGPEQPEPATPRDLLQELLPNSTSINRLRS